MSDYETTKRHAAAVTARTRAQANLLWVAGAAGWIAVTVAGALVPALVIAGWKWAL